MFRTLSSFKGLSGLVVLSALVLSACGSFPPSQSPSADMYKSLGARQCEGGGLDLAALRAQLETAGVPVRNAQCGADGMLQPAVCGAGDGRIGIVEIAAGDVERARQQGFAPLSQLPDAQVIACHE